MLRLWVQIGLVLLLVVGSAGLSAQESEQPGDTDDSSREVEQTDESYRRQMELEDARGRDRTYVDTTHTQKADPEKIDKLPKESRDNIRDQMVDIIMENGEWEPKDALQEYPYTPTAAAEGDPELKQQEQEAWEEQIEKYHEREAAAFGTHRGPVPGPGNPTGQEGGEQGQDGQQGQQGGEQGSGQGGQSGDGSSGSGSAGTYQPYQSSASSSEDEVSTAGVSESALDFLRGGKGRQQPPPQGSGSQQQVQEQARQARDQAQESQSAAEQLAQQQAAESQQAESEPETEQMAQESSEQAEQTESEQQESAESVAVDTRGIIAIKDLDKLEGADGSAQEQDQDDP